MSEAGFIKKVHSKLDKGIYRCKFADRFTSGLPDCWYSGRSGDLWVEYKYCQVPTRKPALSKHQQRWLKNRSKEGRKVAVVVGGPNNIILYEQDTWEYQTVCHDLKFMEYVDWLEGKLG